MATTIRILILEDSPADAELMLVELRRAGFEPDWHRVDTESDYIARLDESPVDVILADYALPQFTGLHALIITRSGDWKFPSSSSQAPSATNWRLSA